MFTGIVQGRHPIVDLDIEAGESGRVVLELPDELREGLKLGDSVAVDGVCLTVCDLTDARVSFDVIRSTLARTLIGQYTVGRAVNVERSLTLQSEMGGHEVSGHVDVVARVASVESTPNNHCLHFRLPPAWGRYMFPRGYVAINGVSLTVSECLEGGTLFSVWLIPETLRLTNLGDLQVGDPVNIEIHRGVQVVVDTIESSVQRFLHELLEGGRNADEVVQALEKLQKAFAPGLTPADDADVDDA